MVENFGKRPLSVLHVIARLNVGGTARYVGRLMLEMQSSDFRSYLATGYVQGSESEDPVVNSLHPQRISNLGRTVNPIADFAALIELRRLISNLSPDIINTHTFKAGALVRLLNPRQPVVHTFHGHLLDDPDFTGYKLRAIVELERLLAPRAARIVTVGERVRDDLLERGIGRPDQYTSIPPGVDPLVLMEQQTARRALGLPAAGVVVSWVARVTGVKAPHRVLEIASLLDDVTFVMAGGGDLLKTIQTNAPSNVKVLGWADTATVYSASDIALSTSHNEGMPVSLIEAQLAGLPVVGVDVGSVAEVVSDGQTGYVGTPESLAPALAELIVNNALRRKMGSAAKERASQAFSPGRMIQSHETLYHFASGYQTN